MACLLCASLSRPARAVAAGVRRGPEEIAPIVEDDDSDGSRLHGKDDDSDQDYKHTSRI